MICSDMSDISIIASGNLYKQSTVVIIAYSISTPAVQSSHFVIFCPVLEGWRWDRTAITFLLYLVFHSLYLRLPNFPSAVAALCSSKEIFSSFRRKSPTSSENVLDLQLTFFFLLSFQHLCPLKNPCTVCEVSNLVWIQALHEWFLLAWTENAPCSRTVVHQGHKLTAVVFGFSILIKKIGQSPFSWVILVQHTAVLVQQPISQDLLITHLPSQSDFFLPSLLQHLTESKG